MEVPDRAAHRVRGIDESERAPGMAAGAGERDAVADRPEPHGDKSSQTAAVHFDPDVRRFRPLGEEMLHAPQVAQALFAHDAHEEQVVFGLDPGVLHRTQDGEHEHDAACVVADSGSEEGVPALTHRHVRAFGEHRVEVAAEADRPLTGTAAA